MYIKFTNKWFLLCINFTIIMIIFFIFAPKYTLEHFINTLFYVFLICLVVILFLYIKKGGFFDGLAFSFRRYISMVSKSVDKIDSWKDKTPPSKNVNKTFYSMLSFQLLYQFLLLILLLIIYYLTLALH